MEEHREQIKVQQQLMSRKEPGGRMGGNMGGRGSHSSGGGRVSQPQDEGWNTVPISKNRPIDTTRLSKITKVANKTLHAVLSFLYIYVVIELYIFGVISSSLVPWTLTISCWLLEVKACGVAGEKAAVEGVELNQQVESKVTSGNKCLYRTSSDTCPNVYFPKFSLIRYRRH